LGPGFQPHFLDQTEIKDLGVVPDFGAAVHIGMQQIAREIGIIAAEIHPSGGGAGVEIAGHGEMGQHAVPDAATRTNRQLRGKAQMPRNHGPDFLILVGQVKVALKAGQTAGCSHVPIIHGCFL
jgi:hypothetical protein